jgi:hypothetical protein
MLVPGRRRCLVSGSSCECIDIGEIKMRTRSQSEVHPLSTHELHEEYLVRRFLFWPLGLATWAGERGAQSRVALKPK